VHLLPEELLRSHQIGDSGAHSVEFHIERAAAVVDGLSARMLAPGITDLEGCYGGIQGAGWRMQRKGGTESVWGREGRNVGGR